MSQTNDVEQQAERTPSRRRFFKWTGQVVAGASLAGLGLSFANSANALAASNAPDMPNCTPVCPCNGCTQVVCYKKATCRGGCGREILHYHGGCEPCNPWIEQAGCCSPGSC